MLKPHYCVLGAILVLLEYNNGCEGFAAFGAGLNLANPFRDFEGFVVLALHVVWEYSLGALRQM